MTRILATSRSFGSSYIDSACVQYIYILFENINIIPAQAAYVATPHTWEIISDFLYSPTLLIRDSVLITVTLI